MIELIYNKISCKVNYIFIERLYVDINFVLGAICESSNQRCKINNKLTPTERKRFSVFDSTNFDIVNVSDNKVLFMSPFPKD